MNLDVTPTFWLAAGAGLLTFLSPCVLPIVPSYLAIIGGLGWSDMQQAVPRDRIRLLVHGIAFTLGFSVIFIALGWSAGWIGTILLRHRLMWQRVGAVFILFLACVNLFPRAFPWFSVDRRLRPKGVTATVVGSFATGLGFAAGWAPCIGPILGSILVLGSMEPTRSAGLLAAYSAGVAAPFIATALFVPIWSRMRGLARWIQPLSGVLLVATAALLWFDGMTRLLAWTIGWTQFTGW